MFFNDLYALFVYFVCAIVISYVAFAISYIFGIRAFLFPWAISLSMLSVAGYFAMVIFFILLTLGFVYEYKKGALEWE